jgi:DNA-directed RNA polymerase sigma subunit (sigma70/sigma32)
MNYKCPHNLFWEGLKLNLAKIKITEKALVIGSCCCLVHEPWTPEEIGTAWGLARERIKQCEAIALKKVREENRFNRRNACVGSLEKRTFT